VALLAGMLATGWVLRVVASAMFVRLLGVDAIFQSTDFYTQRFFLGGRAEWGLHWRAGPGRTRTLYYQCSSHYATLNPAA
jgi:hypothetical protein